MGRFNISPRVPGTAILVIALLAGCSAPGDSATPKATRLASAAGLAFAVPEAWVVDTPSSSMRAAQFTLPAAEEKGEGPELAVFFFGAGQGGNVQANIDRWIGQMQQADGKPSAEKAKRESRKVGKFKVSLVRVDGDYGGGMMGDPHANPHGGGAKQGYRLWAAVVEGEGGPWFFKATGPKAAMEMAAPGFEALVASLQAAPPEEKRDREDAKAE